MENKTLLEYFAAISMQVQRGNAVDDKWMEVKKEILGRMENNIYSTTMSFLSQSISLMQMHKHRGVMEVYFHNILGQLYILHVCGIISDDEKQFWEDLVYKAYEFDNLIKGVI